MSQQRQPMAFFAFIEWLEQEGWPKLVYLHPADYAALLARVQSTTIKDLSGVNIYGCEIRPKGISTVNELDVSAERRWDA